VEEIHGEKVSKLIPLSENRTQKQSWNSITWNFTASKVLLWQTFSAVIKYEGFQALGDWEFVTESKNDGYILFISKKRKKKKKVLTAL